jgi:protein required for attachment to host cells/ribosome-associated translation inhibitor RaiA
MSMAAKQLPTWIVVLDGAQARFFALRQGEEGQVFEETAAALTASPREGSKPGRGFATGKARGVVEPRQNVRKLEKHDFIHDVADMLDAAAGKRTYAQLVLVAPPRSLGELREVLSERVLGSLIHEIPKTLTKLPTDALWSKLSTMLLTAARPLTSKRATGKASPAVPVSVVFRNMESSPAVHADALRYVVKLSRKFSRIKDCKVTVEAPHRHNLKGRTFSVSLDINLAGRKISTKSAADGKHTHEDAHLALRSAFEAVERQLRDTSGRRSSAGRASRSPSRKVLEDVD